MAVCLAFGYGLNEYVATPGFIPHNEIIYESKQIDAPTSLACFDSLLLCFHSPVDGAGDIERKT